MDYTELKEWAKTPCSKKASVDRTPIRRNLILLKTPEALWTEAHAKAAQRTISFIARMNAVHDGRPISKDCPYSGRVAALRNWAFNPSK